MDKEPVQVTILGTSFAVKTDEDPEYLHNLISYLAEKVKEIEQSVVSKDPLRVSILAGMLIADELFKEREKHSRTAEESKVDEAVSQLTSEIIQRLDQNLLE